MKYTLRESMGKLRNSANKINFKRLFYSISAIAIVLILVSGYIAYTRLYLTPERRFWMAMNNSLSTPSVTRSTETGGTGNKSTEDTRFVFGGQAVQDKQNSVGFKTATSESNVTTETITTPETQYVKYINIFSSEKKDDGTSYNFDTVENIWAKDTASDDPSAADNQRLQYVQPLITLVPFGNLTADARNAVLADLRNSGAYIPDFKDVSYKEIDGKKYMSVSVRVMTKKYVGVLQRYLRVAGLGEFPPLDPSGYSDKARVNATFLIDTRSNTLASINYNDQTENYLRYGVTKQVDLPKKTITLDELQAKLQAAQ